MYNTNISWLFYKEVVRDQLYCWYKTKLRVEEARKPSPGQQSKAHRGKFTKSECRRWSPYSAMELKVSTPTPKFFIFIALTKNCIEVLKCSQSAHWKTEFTAPQVSWPEHVREQIRGILLNGVCMLYRIRTAASRASKHKFIERTHKQSLK